MGPVMGTAMRPVMRTATTIEGAAGKKTVEFAVEAEKLGLDVCWVAEAWGADAPSVLGYLAARTESMLLGSGVIQLGTRSPVTIAQTAMTLAHLSGGRFLLGLGVSGPQVIEGLHGIPFGHPLARMRETVAIVRSVFTGEKVSFAGTQYRIPLEESQGAKGARPMRVSLPPTSVPVYLASLSPRMLELTGEIADGWLGTSFVPEGANAYYFTHLDAGLARADRRRADLDICQGAEINLVDEADLARTLAGRKKELAFSLGGMGSATANFYHDAYSRQGWAEVAARVRERWQAGDRDGAAGLVTDEMVLATTLIGTEDMVRARLRTWRDVGVDTVRLYPAGDTLSARLDNLGRGIDLVRAVGSSLSRTGLLPALARCTVLDQEGIRRLVADVQVHVEAGEAQQPPDAGLAAGDDQFTAVSGQDFVRPRQDGKAGAVGEAERGQVRHQGLRRAVQDIGDGLPQVVRAAHVKLAFEPHQ